MRPLSSFFGPFRWLLPLLCLLACAGAASAQTTTTITGKVYSPLGPTAGDPIPNILVYVAQSPVQPFTNQGIVQGAGCAGQPNLVSGNPLVEALTAADGSFTLTSASMPNPATIVIQAGKWRRVYPNTTVIPGQITTLQLTMPANQSEGDLPHIAIVTGNADAIECIFNQIGISNTEFTDPSGGGSINLFEGNAKGGAVVSAQSPTEASLVEDPTTLSNYDLVMFGCQGTASDSIATNDTGSALENLVGYANSGGRIFATHYGYVWLDTIQPFKTSADWTDGVEQLNSGPGVVYPATIDTTYPEGEILAQWLSNINALYNNTPDTVGLEEVRTDTTAVNNPPAQSWVRLNSSTKYTGNPSMQFTFDTPIGAAGTPTVTIAYSNSSAYFQQGTPGIINIDVTNTSTTAADSTLTLSITLPGGVTATSLTDSGGGGWNCTIGTPTSTCTRTTPLAANTSDSVQMVFGIAPTMPVGQASIGAVLTGGGLSGTAQCGRVLFNDYHVETASIPAGTIYPKECTALAGAPTAQEKFLEFSLYNLSNFVSPSTTDLIEIQGPVTLTWPQPAAVPYGTPLSSTQLDATATDPESGVTVPGAYTYTPAAGTPAAPVPSETLSVSFTPTDSTDYASATKSIYLQVTQDPTATTLTTPVTPIYYGQVIALAAVESAASTGPATIDGGVLNFYINGVLSCSLIEPFPPNQPLPECPATTGAGYNAGAYTVYSAYSGDDNFLPSQSPTYPVVVQSDPTATTLTASASASMPGQSLTFTANVADTYYSPVSGSITFYDGTNILGVVPATANAATFTTANLSVGVHAITACFASAINSSGTYNFANTCSNAISEVVTLPPSVTPTTTLLASSLNPSVVGQAVTFTATTATTGAFLGTPAGNVLFYDGANLIGSGILTDGVATLTTSTLAAGLHNITAAYVGNSATAPSTSVILAQQVNVSLVSAGPGFLMTVSPTTFSVGAGSSTSVGVTILELNNFNEPVQLSCSGLPAEATCTFATPVIPATGGTTPLTITVSAPHNCGSSTPYFTAQSGRTGLPIFAAVVLLFFARRRRLLKGLVLAAALCVLPAINGCAGNCTDLGTKPGTYTFTVTGTANAGAIPVVVTVPGETDSNGTVTQSQTMTMTVTI